LTYLQLFATLYSREIDMAKYKLVEWEENGYHDSYGYIAYWDSEKKTIDRICHWATAFGGGADLSDLLDPTEEAVEEAIKYHGKIIARSVLRKAVRSHYEPTDQSDLKRGDVVVFKKAHNSRKSGIKLEVGSVAEVVSVQVDSYKTRPYSKVTFFNVMLKVGNKYVSVPMEKLRKAGRPAVKVSEVRANAQLRARACNFRSLYFGGWDDKNWARDLVKEKEKKSA
jgi:hypothetical protein